MRDKSRKETSSSKKSANGTDQISVYDSDVKGPSKYIGPFKCLASRTGIHPTTKLHSKNLDFHPVCLTRNWKKLNDAPGLWALVPAPGLDNKYMQRTKEKRNATKRRWRIPSMTFPPHSCESAFFVERITTRAKRFSPLKYCMVVSWKLPRKPLTHHKEPPPFHPMNRMQPENKGAVHHDPEP
ncbi:hypothetical protein TNCV_1469531 [Trichonephila clavipes]|nr:hypothetical protein TNCV_1469531 [Trichonephila clavipes]